MCTIVSYKMNVVVLQERSTVCGNLMGLDDYECFYLAPNEIDYTKGLRICVRRICFLS